jgi:hypothetical protein
MYPILTLGRARANPLSENHTEALELRLRRQLSANLVLGIALPITLAALWWFVSWQYGAQSNSFIVSFGNGDLLVLASLIIFTYIIDYILSADKTVAGDLIYLDRLLVILFSFAFISLVFHGFFKFGYTVDLPNIANLAARSRLMFFAISTVVLTTLAISLTIHARFTLTQALCASFADESK